MKSAKWALKLFSFCFTNSCNSGRFLFPGLSLSRCRNLASETIDTFTNCYQDNLCQYVLRMTQFSVGYCTILFPLNFKHFFTIYVFDLVKWNLWKKKLDYYFINYRFKYFNIIWLIIDLNILDRSEVDFQVRWIYLHSLVCTVLSRIC